MMLPVTNGSQTNWDNPYTALIEADELRQLVYCDGKNDCYFRLTVVYQGYSVAEEGWYQK